LYESCHYRRQSAPPQPPPADSLGRERFVGTASAPALADLEAAGITETAIIHHPEDATVYREAAASAGTRLTMIGQAEPLGFGDAVLRARAFAGGEAFVLIVCDHLFLSQDPEPRSIPP